jgi:hypothetical protein
MNLIKGGMWVPYIGSYTPLLSCISCARMSQKNFLVITNKYIFSRRSLAIFGSNIFTVVSGTKYLHHLIH